MLSWCLVAAGTMRHLAEAHYYLLGSWLRRTAICLGADRGAPPEVRFYYLHSWRSHPPACFERAQQSSACFVAAGTWLRFCYLCLGSCLRRSVRNCHAVPSTTPQK